jgi:NAD(P)-dependent dehydrogenase (short-subunit alcohol dehydrogenase family)
MKTQRVVLITNVRNYAGPGAVAAFLELGDTVFCHDRSFSDPTVRHAYLASFPDAQLAASDEPAALVVEALERFGRIDVVISNDYVPGETWSVPDVPPDPTLPVLRARPFEELTEENFTATLDALVLQPFRLAQAALPQLKERRSGAMIFITSAAAYRAGPRTEAYNAARSAANSMVQGIAIEAAPFGIQVNPVGPAWFQNPTYYPDRDAPLYAERVQNEVPLKRLGTQAEMGALLVYLASGTALPLTGQFLPFPAGTRLTR